MPSTHPRDVACRFLFEAARAYPELYPRPIDARELDDRDRRLAEAIVRSTLSRWATLETILQHALDRPWKDIDARVQGALLSGATQLFLLDRVPDHAVVAETVEWTKRHGKRKGAAGMVNAVLRRLIELRGERIEVADGRARNHLLLADGSGWQLEGDVFAQEPAARIAQQSGHASMLIQRWWAQHGEATATELALHGLCAPPIILHGAGADPALAPHDEAGFQVLQDQDHHLSEVLERHPGAMVQDPTTSNAVRRTMGLSPKVVLDYCAGRGTKTRQLAAVHPDARIIATDVDEVRFDALTELAATSERIEVVEPDEARAMIGAVDLLVLDVPCSNTGVLPRRPEARLRFSMAGLETLVGMQRQIFADTIPCLAPAAHVLYSTCSLEPEENEQMPAWLAKWHGWEVADETRMMPRGLPGDGPDRYCDGGYAALMKTH